ncbi:MAG TPA: ABC transporter ATP-binding protein [Candidatus Baltobacteraceae bacterium]|nr:ABC transporter ATP-binding protein [Candidatus Baltobacteraceae bacterium]
MDCASVDVHRLTKRYGRIEALRDLTLRIDKGEIFGFLGPNGAGKTTSVKMLVGLARPTTGSGNVLGFPLGDRRARLHLGYLPELFRYPEWLTAREVLRYHAHLARMHGIEGEIARALERVGLAARSNDRVATFSKGMQQRLGLAVALLGKPELVVLDEPTSALDPSGRLEVREILRELRRAGTCVFLNSHLLTEVEQVCDRVAIVTRGRVVAHGTIAQILGEGHGVRIRASANGTPLDRILARFGRVEVQADGATVQGLAQDGIPAVVAALVEAGAAVYGVEQLTATLEERFLEMTAERGS